MLATKTFKTKFKRVLSKTRELLVKNKLLLFILGFAAIGSAALLISRAASPTVSVQPESGTKSSQITTVNDANASGGSAIQFNKAGSSSGPNTFSYTDPRCSAAASCTMTFQDHSSITVNSDGTWQVSSNNLNVDPWTGQAFNDPRPGLICNALPSNLQTACNARTQGAQFTTLSSASLPSSGCSPSTTPCGGQGYSPISKVANADLTNITAMPSCDTVGKVQVPSQPAGTLAYHNCRPHGQTSNFGISAPGDNNNSYYYDNCIMIGFTEGSQSSPVNGAKVFFTNCHLYVTADSGATYGLDSEQHFIHDLIDGSPMQFASTLITNGKGCGTDSNGNFVSGSYNACNHPIVFRTGAQNQYLYNESESNTDQADAMNPTDAEWNYMNAQRCINGVETNGCSHTDNGFEMYQGGSITKSNTAPNIYANNYITGQMDSSQMVNLTDDFGSGGYTWIINNKAVANNSSGNGMVVTAQNGRVIAGVHIVGNLFFSPPGTAGSLNRTAGGGGACANALPNTCIVEISGNHIVNASNVQSTWP